MIRLVLLFISALVTSLSGVRSARAANEVIGGATSVTVWTSNADALMLLEMTEELLDQAALKLGSVSPMEKAFLRTKLGPAAFRFSKSMRFLKAKSHLFLFETRNEKAVDFMIAEVRSQILTPLLNAQGQKELASALNSLSDTTLASFPFTQFRQWLKTARGNRKFKTETDIGLSLSPDPRDGDLLLISLSLGSDDQKWLNRRELKALIEIEDRSFADELEKLGLDPVVYDNALLMKAFATPTIKKNMILTKIVHEINREAPEVLRFYLQSESLIESLDAGNDGAELESPGAFASWFDLQWRQALAAREATKVQLFQIKAIGDYLKSDKGPDAKRLLKKSMLEIRDRRLRLSKAASK